MKLVKAIIIFALAAVMLISAAGCKKDNGDGTTTSAPTAAPTTNAPTTTAAPTTIGEPAETGLEEEVLTMVDSLTSYYSLGENLGWQNAIYLLGEENTGVHYAAFYVTPFQEKVDGSVCFADGQKTVTGFADLSIMIRMNADGFFDARNGDNFEKLADVAYEADNAYFVELTADMNNKTYTVYVTAPEGEKTMIAENYAFRTTANDADDFGKMFLVNAGGNELIMIEGFKRLEVYDPAKAYYSTGENFGWQQKGIYLGRDYTGKLKISFDMIKLIDMVDGSVDFTDGDIEVFSFGDLAMLVRMEIWQGVFDVRNVTQQERIADVYVYKDVRYRVEIEADMDTKLYSVWVTPEGKERVQVAKDYGFRVTANHAAKISKVYVISAHENDSIKMENLTIEEVN